MMDKRKECPECGCKKIALAKLDVDAKLYPADALCDILPPPTLRLEAGASWDVPANVSIITKLSPFAQRFYI